LASQIISSVQSISGNQPRIRRIIEEAGQTALSGVPVQINATDGGVQEWDGTTVAAGIAGFSKEFFNNLTTTGVPKQITQGKVPYQASAVNIQRPFFDDGRIGFETATEDTVFQGQVGPSQTALVSDVGVSYGMTKDSDGHWFVDKTKTTVGTNTVVTIVNLNPDDQSATPRGVYFQVQQAAIQLVG
jgi:hypothetical protein